jgi:hypothetical protein
VIKIDTTKPVEPREREALFELDGVEYTIPNTVTARESLQHRINTAEAGGEYATVVAARWMISDNGFAALMARDNVPDSDLDAILTAIVYRITGLVPPKSADDVAGADGSVA